MCFRMGILWHKKILFMKLIKCKYFIFEYLSMDLRKFLFWANIFAITLHSSLFAKPVAKSLCSFCSKYLLRVMFALDRQMVRGQPMNAMKSYIYQIACCFAMSVVFCIVGKFARTGIMKVWPLNIEHWTCTYFWGISFPLSFEQ